LYKLIPPRSTFAQDMTEVERKVMQEHATYWKGGTDQRDCARLWTTGISNPPVTYVNISCRISTSQRQFQRGSSYYEKVVTIITFEPIKFLLLLGTAFPLHRYSFLSTAHSSNTRFTKIHTGICLLSSKTCSDLVLTIKYINT
jgi:hypothetical protein